MQMERTSNKTIAKNTIFLYFRMMFTMVISLYTSRIVLQVLGVDDFGLYAAVGGIVGMLSFLHSALSTGTSRFLTFELGAGDFEKLQKTFRTLLTLHIFLSIFIVIVAETAGLWFVYNKAGIPPDRMNAAVWVYHLSVFAAFFSITHMPYSAAIIAHEKMNVFAYAGIVEVLAKLGIVFVLQVGNTDRLILYALLLAMIHIGMAMFYRFYCTSKFKESHYKLIIDKKILRSVIGFSGWSLFSNLAIALNSQGTNIITNMFFGPAVVAARAISVQVNMAAGQFVQNFRTAANPQIVKSYAAGDYNGSKQLLLHSTRFSFYLLLLLGLPIILLAEPLLQLWLGQVPEYAVIFLKLIIVQSLFSVFDSSFYMALFAKGRLRENALISPLLGFIQFPVIYLLFRMGYSPLVLSVAGIIVYAVLGLLIKPVLICKIANYTFNDIMNVFWPCLKVTVLSVPLPALASHYFHNNMAGHLGVCFFAVVTVLCVSFFFGIEADMRHKIIGFLNRKRIELTKTK